MIRLTGVGMQVNGQPRVRTADDFVAGLRQLRVRAGNPSLRQLGRLAEQRLAPDPLAPSTTSEVLAGKRLPRLPRLEFVESYVAACLRFGHADEPAVAAEVARWRELWRALATEERPEEPPAAVRRPRRSLTLPLVAVVFLAGLGAGVAGTRWWSGAQRLFADPDTCLAAGAERPAGQDVLGLPTTAQQAGSWWADKPDVARLETDGRQFRAAVSKGTARPGDVVIVKDSVTVEKGGAYALAFTVSADRATRIRVRVQDNQGPLYHPSLERELEVGPSPCTRVYRFPGDLTSSHSELTFQVGGRADDFRLQVTDVQLVRE